MLVVSLGCEKLRPSGWCPDGAISDADRAPCRTSLRRLVAPSVDAIMTPGRSPPEDPEQAHPRDRARPPISSSACNAAAATRSPASPPTPRWASAADLLVRAGATVMFSEVTEVRDAIQLLTRRAANEDVGRALVREMAWYDAYLAAAAPTAAPTPRPATRRAAWPTSSRRHSARSSSPALAPITGVLAPGEKRDAEGPDFAATPASDFICGTLQLAAGMNLHVFTTGRGTPYGLAAAPVIKVATRTELARRWHDLIDVDAGGIADRRDDHRGNRLGPVPPDPRCRQRPQKTVGRAAGAAQRADAVQSGAGDLSMIRKSAKRFSESHAKKRCEQS